MIHVAPEYMRDVYAPSSRAPLAMVYGQLAAQSLVDFSLQMPANLALFVVLAAIALHRPLRSAPHARRV
jgi:hypothetical protein